MSSGVCVRGADVQRKGAFCNKSAFLVGVSALALMIGQHSAWADCAPDPVADNGTVVCSGTDANGFQTSSANVQINVDAGASVTPGSNAAAVQLNNDYSAATIDVAGTIDGQSVVGLLAQGSGSTVTLTIANTGVVQGGDGISASLPGGGTIPTLNIDNSGAITGTNGWGVNLDSASVGTLTNRSGATITGGFIAYSMGTVNNDGVIDGGTNLGLTVGSYGTSVTNTGIIKSSATSSGLFYGQNSALSIEEGTVTNSGTIEALGSGQAVSAYTVLTLNNQAGGVISAAQGTAVQGGYAANLVTNAGTINGDVVLQGFYYQGDKFIQQGGTVQGNVTFGNANDSFIIDLAYGTDVGVSGTIDGGGGTNTFGVTTAADATFTPVAMPTFQKFLATVTSADATLTLDTVNTPLGVTLDLEGVGGIVNNSDVSTVDAPAATISFDYQGVAVTNNATLVASGVNLAAVELGWSGKLVNTGTIHGEGSGTAAISTSMLSQIDNSGQIVADQAAAISGNSPATIVNQAGGVISGGAGTAIQDRGEVDNSGTITGSVNLIYSQNTYIAEAGGSLQGNLTFSGNNNVFKVDYSLLGSGLGVTGTIDPGTGYANLFDVMTSGTQSLSLPNIGGFERFGIETADSATTTTFGTSADTVTQEIEIFGPGTVVNQANLVSSQAAGHNDGAAAEIGGLGTVAGGTFDNQGQITASYAFGIGIATLGPVTVKNSGTVTASNGAIGVYGEYAVNNLGASIINSGTITATDALSKAVSVVDTNTLHNQGSVQGVGIAVAIDGGGIVDNSGTISSQDVAIGASPGFLWSSVIRNEASGTISGTNYAIQHQYGSTLLYNAGTIDGAVNLSYGNNIYVDAGGTITGPADFSSSTNVFLIKQNTSAAVSDLSNFNTAYSTNVIGWAIDGQGTVDLTPVTGYSGFAVGTMTADSTATISSGTVNLSRPVLMIGTGTVINQADLNSGLGFALQSSSYSTAIINKGALTGLYGIAASNGAGNIENDNSITTNSVAIQIGLANAVTPSDETPWATINNNGTIVAGSYNSQAAILVSGYFYGPYGGVPIDLSAGVSTAPVTMPTVTPPSDYTLVQINNSGSVTTSGDNSMAISASGGTHIKVNNSGTIETTGKNAAGVWLQSDGGSIVNSGTISTQGVNAPAVQETYYGYPPSTAPMSLVNSGTIAASGGGVQTSYTGQQYQYVNGSWVIVTLPTVTNTVSAPTVIFDNGTLENDAGGKISATGLASYALQLTSYSSKTVTVNNAGTIIGDSGGTYPVSTYQPGVQGTVTIPGAILGGAGVEIINNAGLISGGVDLGAGDDSVDWQQGGSFVGTVDGGAGANSLTVEADNARIDASDPFLNFQMVELASGGNLDVTAGSTLTTDSIKIDVGGTLSGAGTIVGAIDNFGAISVGDGTISTASLHPAAVAPPTMTINGDVTFEAGSTLTVPVTGGQTSLLSVNGNVTVNGGTLQFVVDNTSPASFNLPVLTASGTLTGAFDQITANGFMNITAVPTANGLSFDFLRQIGPGLSLSPQSRRVADYFNGLFVAGAQGGAVDSVIALSDLTADQLDVALGQLQPEAYGSALQMGLRQSIAVADAFDAGLDTTARTARQGWGVWAQGLGAFATRKADAALGTAKFSTDNYGMLSGLDYAWGRGARAGVMVGYTDSSQNFTGLDANTKAHGYVIGGYGAYRFNGLAVTSLIAYNGSTAKTHRQITATSAEATGKYDLNSLMVRGKVSYDLDLHSAVHLTPMVGLTYARVKRQSAIEQGAGSLDLSVDSAHHNMLLGDVGIKVAGTSQVGGNMTLIPQATLGWRHDFNNDPINVTAHFVGLESQPALQVRAPGVSRNQVLVSAGATLLVTERLSLSARYQGEFGGGLTSNSVNLGASLRF